MKGKLIHVSTRFDCLADNTNICNCVCVPCRRGGITPHSQAGQETGNAFLAVAQSVSPGSRATRKGGDGGENRGPGSCLCGLASCLPSSDQASARRVGEDTVQFQSQVLNSPWKTVAESMAIQNLRHIVDFAILGIACRLWR